MAKQFTLGKNERLKSRKQIEQLFKEGKSFSIFPYKVFYILCPAPGSQLPTSNSRLLFGVGVGTRNFKRAPDRNRIKRLTREAYRLQKKILLEKIVGLHTQLAFFFIYTGKEMPDQAIVNKIMALIINKLLKVIDENIAADT